jgi:hypothetical protein
MRPHHIARLLDTSFDRHRLDLDVWYTHRMGLGVVTNAAVRRGLAAALVVDNRGNVGAWSGAVTNDECNVLVNVLMSLGGDERARSLFAGELIEFSLDGRDTRIGVAGQCLFVVAIGAADVPESLTTKLTQEFRDQVAMVIDAMRADAIDSTAPPPTPSGAGGPPSGPAGLPLVEIGVTFGLGRPKRGSA